MAVLFSLGESIETCIFPHQVRVGQVPVRSHLQRHSASMIPKVWEKSVSSRKLLAWRYLTYASRIYIRGFAVPINSMTSVDPYLGTTPPAPPSLHDTNRASNTSQHRDGDSGIFNQMVICVLPFD